MRVRPTSEAVGVTGKKHLVMSALLLSQHVIGDRGRSVSSKKAQQEMKHKGGGAARDALKPLGKRTPRGFPANTEDCRWTDASITEFFLSGLY